MAGVGEALAVVGLLEPAFKACFKSYGSYKLSKNFGQDFQKAERGLRGQMARLRLLGDTKINDLLSAPEDGTELSSDIKWTLQAMRRDFERCEKLMEKYGEPQSPRKRLTKPPPVGAQTQSPPLTASSSHLSPESPSDRKTSNTFFSRRPKVSSSVSSSSRSQPLSASTTSDTNATSSTSPSSVGSLYDPKITQALQDDALRSAGLQSSSTMMLRLKWIAEDRSQLFRSIEDLTKANDLLENLLKIKPLDDSTFAVTGSAIPGDTESSVHNIRLSLEKLHQDLLKVNPNGRDIEFCLKLALDRSEKETYAEYVDTSFDPESAVFSLQAHLKSNRSSKDRSVYLLAETLTDLGPANDTESYTYEIVNSFQQVEPDADPVFQCISKTLLRRGARSHLKIYQDKTSEWTRIQSLSTALQNQTFKDIAFQKQYIQLGLFMAFSYAVLPFTFKGKTKFPQASNYVYYDQASSTTSEVAEGSPNSADDQDNNSSNSSSSSQAPGNNTSPEEAFEDLHSPYINFNFGSRATNLTTKAIGKRPGFTALTNNPVVSLGLLLYQIGSWEHMATRDIAQMRRDALNRSHDLIRLSGVEFADITRTCLNWRDKSSDGSDGRGEIDCEDMLVRIYARLDEYNKELQGMV